MHRAWIGVAALTLAVACGGSSLGPDSGPILDSAADLDAAVRDASTDGALDASSDAAAGDSAVGDSGARDSGLRDSAVVDSGTPPAPAVLALNLHCLDQSGTPYASVTDRMHAIAQLAVREGVVVLLLEEVCDDGATRALDVLRSELDTLSGVSWRADEAFAHVAWAGTPQEARESVALLTATSRRDVRAVDYSVQGALRRVGLMATLGAPLDGLRVMTVHLDFRDADVRVGQARESAVAMLTSYGAAGALVAGDLNARAGSPPLAAFEIMGFVDEGAALPGSRIDHVLLHRGAAFGAASTELVFDTRATSVSDHPGILVRLEPVASPALTWTRVNAHADVGAGHYLALRGDAPGLDWMSGWPLSSADGATWEFRTAEVTSPFEYKVLIDDSVWMTGANAMAAPGMVQDISPSF